MIHRRSIEVLTQTSPSVRTQGLKTTDSTKKTTHLRRKLDPGQLLRNKRGRYTSAGERLGIHRDEPVWYLPGLCIH